MAIPRFYTPLSRLVLVGTACAVAAVTAALGAVKVAAGMGWLRPGPTMAIVSTDVLLGLGLLEILLALLLPWTRTGFVAALLLIGDFANHIFALIAFDRLIEAVVLMVVINALTVVLWAWRPRFLGGNPRKVEIAFVD